ncbi:uncharacterized protein ACNLHF_001153 [Anomaloglossus baeobatrachus]|uniref:uncharacterized protein LOC142250248 n=1 Tax=Anomaloglossus baeobatrachus TaxID=238106 RepID=UPI003F4FDF05
MRLLIGSCDLSSDAMSSLRLGVVSAVLCVLVAVTSGEPSCADVEDFGPCTGDTGGFCPSGIACSCKSSQPFCSCPFYRGPNGNYWYLGAKCNQLWSTLDMIVLCIFPAVALAFVVGVTAQVIHFCKTKPHGRRVKEAKNLERKSTNTHKNLSYVPDPEISRQYLERSAVNVQERVQPKIQTAPQNVPPAVLPKPRGLKYYSDAPPVARSSSYFEGRQQSQNSGSRVPEQEYEEPQYARVSRPAFAPANYPPLSPEPSSQSAAWDHRPISFGRPQIKPVYNY